MFIVIHPYSFLLYLLLCFRSCSFFLFFPFSLLLSISCTISLFRHIRSLLLSNFHIIVNLLFAFFLTFFFFHSLCISSFILLIIIFSRSLILSFLSLSPFLVHLLSLSTPSLHISSFSPYLLLLNQFFSCFSSL